MARRDRLKQGAEAKERVLSGMYSQPQRTTSTPSRRDRLKATPDADTTTFLKDHGGFLMDKLPEVKGQTPAAMKAPTSGGLLMNKLTPDAKLSPPIAVAPAEPSKWSTEYGKTIPVLGSVLTGLEKLTDITKPFGQGAASVQGVPMQNQVPIDSTLDKILYGAGTLAGGLMNPAALEQSLITTPYKAAQGVVSRVAPAASNTAQRAATGGLAGAGTGAAYSLISGQDSGKEVARNALLGGAIGGVGDVALGAAGSAISRLLKRRNVPEEQVQEILALPMGRADAARMRGQVNTPDVITPEYQFALPEPNVAPATTARVEQRVNPYRQKFETLMQRAMERERAGGFTPGREDLEVQQMWAAMAEPTDPSLDELIDLAYPKQRSVSPNAVQNARANQQMRRAAGGDLPVRSIEERYPQGAMANAEGPITVPARAPQAQPTRAQRLNESLNASEAPTARTADEEEAAQILQSTRQPRIRDRVYNFLDEQEQAARQRMAARRGNLSANPLPEWGDMSIIMAAKMGKGTINLADFTEAAVREFGESVRAKAPQLYRSAKEELRRQERKASQEGQAADTFNNSGQGDANSFASKISNQPTKNKKSFSQWYEKVRSQTVDDLAALEGLEKRVTGRVASAENSLYKSARLSRGIPERANMVVQQRLTPLVDAVEKAGYSADDLGMYALARHAKDVNAAGYKSGFTNKEIDDVLNKYANVPAMEQARQGLVQVGRDMLQELADSGVVSKELQSVLNERWQNYIPLFRAFDEEVAGGGFSSADKLANIASPVKALKGSERKVINPLENMVKNIFQSVNAAERNKVAQQLSKLAKQDPDSKFIRKLDPDEKVGNSKNVVSVKENGENVKYEVEPEVAKALLALDKESSNMIINILAKPASLLRAGATLTPEFASRNPMRDLLSAFITSESGFNPLIDFPAGLISTITKGKDYQGFINNLGAYGNVMSMDRNVHREALKKVLGEKPSEKFVNVVSGKGIISLLRKITDATESATKVGEYRAAIRQGQTPQEAAYRARDLMDFARAGSGVRTANKMIAFLNANIQGKSKLLRAVKENPVRVTTKALATVTLPTVGVYMFNHNYANEQQKNTINEAPDWLKDTFWLIAVPGTNTVARIPKPFDLAPIFANLPERALKYTQENDPQAFDGYARQTLASGALPYQISGLLPFIEGMSNYSFFRGANIIPKREEGVEFKDQYDPTKTTEAAKFLSSMVDSVTGGKGPFKNFSSPRIVDNTIQGLTAGLGSYATSAVDSILSGNVFGQQLYDGIVDRPVSPEKRLEQQPFIKAFTVDPLTTSRSLDKLYTERDELTRAKGSANLNEEKFGQSKRLKSLDKTADRISKIGKQIREIESSRTLSAAQKRSQIEPLMLERNLLARNTVQSAR